MRIAVTGAGGRIGRAVVDRAVRIGHSVVSIDRHPQASDVPGSRIVQLDVGDYTALRSAIDGCDALVHLAAISGPGRHPDHVVHHSNVVSSYNALRAAAEVGIGQVCQASSINAIGGRFSRRPRYDYFPVDERHPAYPEDPYSLSKWMCEQQAAAIARRFDGVSISSLRIHGVVEDRSDTLAWIDRADQAVVKHLWGYTTLEATARAVLLALAADFDGHEVFYVVAPETMMDTPSLELRERFYPEVPLRGPMSGTRSFFDCRKAETVLGWLHDGG